MNNPDFKWKYFSPDIILWHIRWYSSTSLSYANLGDMLAKLGIAVNPSTLYRWFIEYGPELKKRLRHGYQFIRTYSSWQLDETYVKVREKSHYLYRAINARGETLDFYLSLKRNNHASYQFLNGCLLYYKKDRKPKTLEHGQAYILRLCYRLLEKERASCGKT